MKKRTLSTIAQTAIPIPEDQAMRMAQLRPYLARLRGGESPMALALIQLLTWQGRPLELRQLVDAWPQTPYHAQDHDPKSPLDFQALTGILTALGWSVQSFTPLQLSIPHPGMVLLAPDWHETERCDCALPDGTWLALGNLDTPKPPLDAAGFLNQANIADAVLLHAVPPGMSNAQEPLESYVQRSVGMRWFGSNIQPLRPLLWQISGLSALITFCALAVPLFVMLCYQQVIHPQRTDALPYLLAGAGIWLLGEALALRGRRRILAWASARLHHRISLSAVERLLSLPASATERASVMAQLLRQKSLEAARDALCSPPFQLAMDAPFVLMLLGVMVAIGGRLAWVPLFLALVYAGLILVLRTPLLAASHRHARALSERQQLMMESIHLLSHWRALGLTKRWLTRFRQSAQQATQAAVTASMLETLLESLSSSLLQIAVLITMSMGILQVWEGNLGVGGLMACMMLCWRILTPLQQLCALTPQIIQMRHSIDQLNRLMVLPQEATLNEAAQQRPAWAGAVRFHQVLMRYERQPDAILAGLSFSLKPGESLCITGGNGVGKSTVLKLAMGMYRPMAGSVRLDGADIRQFDARTLRTALAYLPQSPQFVAGSVGEQLRLLNPLAEDAACWQALEHAQLSDWARSLPDRLDSWLDATMLETMPSLQRHQLHLARLYLSNSAILLIDELPNALIDSKAGEIFREFLRLARGKRTVLFASQREDFLRMADQICWLRADGYPRIGRLNPATEDSRKAQSITAATTLSPPGGRVGYQAV